MSFDYRGCFTLIEQDRDIGAHEAVSTMGSALEATLHSFGLAFAGSSTTIASENGRIVERPGPTRDWAAFVTDAEKPASVGVCATTIGGILV